MYIESLQPLSRRRLSSRRSRADRQSGSWLTSASERRRWPGRQRQGSAWPCCLRQEREEAEEAHPSQTSQTKDNRGTEAAKTSLIRRICGTDARSTTRLLPGPLEWVPVILGAASDASARNSNRHARVQRRLFVRRFSAVLLPCKLPGSR